MVENVADGRCVQRSAKNPRIMAAVNTIAYAEPAAASTTPGPGHTPLSPQPMPNTAEPSTSATSISVRFGNWNASA